MITVPVPGSILLPWYLLWTCRLGGWLMILLVVRPVPINQNFLNSTGAFPKVSCLWISSSAYLVLGDKPSANKLAGGSLSNECSLIPALKCSKSEALLTSTKLPSCTERPSARCCSDVPRATDMFWWKLGVRYLGRRF